MILTPLPINPSVSPPTGGLYVHLPFCLTKCAYCDFYSLPDRQDTIPSFVATLSTEITSFPHTPDWRIDTVFLGGGTPTLLGRKGLDSLLNALHKRFDLSHVVEFTIETNPGEISPDVLNWLPTAGINRLSIGAQSLHNRHLQFLTRIHDSEAIFRTLSLARDSGLENISLDFIYGIPDQTISQWERDLEKISALDVQHISAYTLTVETGTELFHQVRRGTVTMPRDEHTITLFDITRSRLSAAGFKPYEISNFAREGYECRHNLHYWRIEPYLGFGPAAHSFFNNERWQNIAHLDRYMRHIQNGTSPVIHRYPVDDCEFTNEYTGFGLRLEKGFSLSRIPPAYREPVRRQVVQARERFPGCFVFSGDTVRLTDAGRHVADALATAFIVDLET